jgi:hypothetical protein
MRLPVLVLMLLPMPAAADGCGDFWYMRNLIADRAGYCFNSPLGRAIFGACGAGAPRFTTRDEAAMARIREVEDEFDCAIDTDKTELTDWWPRDWSAITVLPIPTGYDSGCIGWTGPEVPLHAAPDAAAATVGAIRAGDLIVWSHEDEGAWQFVVIDYADAMGWVRAVDVPYQLCRSVAG